MKGLGCTCAVALAVVVAAAPVPACANERYRFTSIAETGRKYASLDYPAINNAGDVAFTATPASHAQVLPYAVYIGNGQSTTTHYPWPTPFNPFVHGVHLNDAGSFAYVGQNFGQRGIVRADASAAAFVLLQMGGGSYYGPNSINNANQVLTNLIESGGRGVIYRAEADGRLTQIADTTGPFQLLGSCAMNDDGLTAVSVHTDAGGRLLVRSDGGSPQMLYSGAGPLDEFYSVSINNAGVVAFNARFDGGRLAVLTGNGGPLALRADTSGPFNAFGFVKLNDAGDVVFEATTDAGAAGVFFGPDPDAHRILATGDALLGSTVTQVVFIDGLNNHGQVALRAILADGRTAIVRADPIPEPSAAATVLLTLVSALAFRHRL